MDGWWVELGTGMKIQCSSESFRLHALKIGFNSRKRSSDKRLQVNLYAMPDLLHNALPQHVICHNSHSRYKTLGCDFA